jgi:erythromycin esterase
MLNRRRVLLGGTALAAAATVAKAPLAASALAREPSAEGRAGDDVIAWLRANALALASAEPGGGLHDLEPFRAMIGNARIVSLGEATHGTREFFQLKHRLIEYCVAKLGFTVIGFEAEYGATLAVNDYVLHGKGNAVDVVAGMGFWTWDTEEVVALVEWVRAWNLATERKVKFYGFDMQGSAAATQHLLAYLERVAPELASASATSLAPLALYHTFGAFQRLSAAVQERTLAEIKSLREAFAAERTRWIERSGETEWQLARQSAVVLEQYARSRLVAEEGDFRKEFAFRDRAMADNVHALLDAEGAGARAVLWAHNGHVQRSAYFGLSNMGGFLQAAAGAEPVVIGFAFNQGSFQAMGVIDGDYKLGTHVVGPAPDGSVDATLAAAGIPLLALDLRRVPADGAVARWMAGKPSQRTIGAVFALKDEHEYALAADPRDNFDVLVFVERTTAARGNPKPAPHVVQSDTAGRNAEPTNLALAGGDIPDGWRAIYDSRYPYLVAATDQASPGGGRAVRIARADSTLTWGDGALTQSFPAARWRGQRLVLSAAMRAEAPRIGTGAQLAVNIWPKRKEGTDEPSAKPILALQADGPVRSSGWTRHSVAVDIPADAERVQISLVVTGSSAGWFGDLELTASGAVHGTTPSPRAA